MNEFSKFGGFGGFSDAVRARTDALEIAGGTSLGPLMGGIARAAAPRSDGGISVSGWTASHWNVSAGPEANVDALTKALTQLALGGSLGGHADRAGFCETPIPNRPGTVMLTSDGDGYVEGATLRASVSDPDGVRRVNFQWQSKDDGGTFQNIEGATGRTFTVGNDAGGQDLRVVASYIDKARHAEVATGFVTIGDGPIAVPPTPAPTPTPLNPATPQPEPPIDASPTPPGGDPAPTPSPTPTPTPGPVVTPPSNSNGTLLGVNLAGPEFGDAPGIYGQDYIYPSHSEIDYYASKGMEVIRLPFLWERLQPTQNGPLDPAELGRIQDVVDYATSKGIKVVLDVHNYGYGYGSLIGSAQTPNSSFADFWGKLAGHFADNPDVIFGLMNEPHDQSAAEWLGSANAAIAAIREAGATQQILVPGSYWTGAWTWTSSDNDEVIGTGVQDPLNNYVFEVHQYLDVDGSGTHANVVSAEAGVERLQDVTAWAQATGNKVFLGEFGVADDPTSLAALDLMLDYIHDNSSVWEGATYWAGGPWWGDYMFTIEPNNGVDRPQMNVLGQYV